MTPKEEFIKDVAVYYDVYGELDGFRNPNSMQEIVDFGYKEAGLHIAEMRDILAEVLNMKKEQTATVH